MDDTELKALIGKKVTGIWLTGGILLFLFDSRSPSILGLYPILFLMIGMFAAAVVIGNITYEIQKRAFKRILAAEDMSEVQTMLVGPTPELEKKLGRVGRRIGLLNFVLTLASLYIPYQLLFVQ